MPAPATADELLDLIQRSGVAEEPRLRAYLKKLAETSSVPTDPQKFAGVLVRDGILTYFQAEQLLQGKYKRFTIGKYKVLEKLGAGGMAQVFLCEHKLMRRRVAIKVLPTAKANDPSSLERFYREARAVAAVDHPNIVRAYDIDQDENLHFLVMEYVDGTNLQDLVKKSGPLDLIRACHYIYAAAVGLQHAHEMGLVHRDVKPGNILLDRAGVVKILDMGLARFFNDEDDELTKKYDENVLGTADYLAPEQALDSHAVDIRADIYSLGATFYFLLTGTAPFPEGSVAQKLIWHQNRTPRPLASLRPEIPEHLVAIVDRMMAKKPEERFQTPADVMAVLAPWVTTPIAPPTDREMPQVSLAAGGITRGPASMAIPSHSTTSAGARTSIPHGMPTIAATQPRTQVAVPTLPPPHSANPQTPSPPLPGAAVWESLDTDTLGATQGDTDRNHTGNSSSIRRRRAPAPVEAGSRRLLFGLLGLVALLGTAAGVYFAFLSGDPTPQPDPKASEPLRIVVGEGENAVGTLREALAKAGPGATIVITKARVVEPALRLDRVRHKDLTIEGTMVDGHSPVIEAGSVIPALLDLYSSDGVRLKNLELDGRGVAEDGIQIHGVCPGLTIENIVVRGMKSAGVRFLNSAGDEQRPIVIERLRVLLTLPTQTALILEAAKTDTRKIQVRNSRFEGPATGPSAGVGLRIQGATTEVEFTGNRFFNLDSAIAFGRPPVERVVRVRFADNTVFQARSGLLFDYERAPANTTGKFDLTITQNYFGTTTEIAKSTVGGVVGVTATNNVQGPGSAPGNVPLKAVRIDTPTLPTPKPDDDATFLRFPGGPPEFGPTKFKAGAS